MVAGALARAVGGSLGAYLVAAFLLSVAFWRGAVVTREPPGYEEVQGRFGVDLGVLFAGLILVIARGTVFERSVWQTLAILGIAYVVVSMIALAAARLEELREPGAAQAVILAIAVQLGLLVILSFFALEFFALDIGGWIGNVTQPVQEVIGRGLTFVATLIATPIAALIEHLHVHRAPHPPHPNTAAFNQHGRPKKLPSSKPGAWVNVVAAVVVLLIFAGLASLVWRTLPRIPRRRPSPKYQEERRSLWSFSQFWRALLAWVRGLFRRGAEAAEEAVRQTRRRIWGEYPADPVRRLYAQLLRRAASFGLIREPSVTPLEFQLALAAAWPEGAGDFASLTDAYVLRRYGDITFGEQEVHALQDRWQRVRALMRRPKAEREREVSTIGGEKRGSPQPDSRPGAQNFPQRAANRIPGILKELSGWVIIGLLAPVIVLLAVLAVVILAGHH